MMTRRPAFPLPTVGFAALVAVTGLTLFAWPGRSWQALMTVDAVLVVLMVIDTVACVTLSVAAALVKLRSWAIRSNVLIWSRSIVDQRCRYERGDGQPPHWPQH